MNLVRRRKRWLMVALPMLLQYVPLPAQTSSTEFFPEIDVNVGLHSNVKVLFQAKETREGGQPTQAEIGPSMEFYLKPLVSLKKITLFDPDETKSRPLVLSLGYRYLPAPDKPAVNRMEPVATINLPLTERLLITDRNRADLDWSNGSFNWRYRNRFTVERRLSTRSYHPAPYVSAEAFYESQYSKWSSTNLYAGCLLPLGKRAELDPYYEHQNNTGKHPNEQINAGGLILNLYF